MHQWMKLAGLGLLLLCGMASASEVFVTYYHNDHLGSPVAATDESGNLLWREHYRPFGERQDRPGYQGYGTLGFTGHAQSQDSGLVYAGARYYDPLIGRFLSVDPKEASEETPGSFNRYAYSLNNPYSYSDPDGHWVAAALGVLDAGLTIHGIHSEYRSGGIEAAQAEVGKAVAAHLVGGLAGNVLRRGYILAKEGSIAAKGILTPKDFPEVSGQISRQKQLRHLEGTPQLAERGKGGYLNDISDAQKVLDAYRSGNAVILGKNAQGFPVVRVDGITGTNVNIGAGINSQPTNVSIIKGAKSPSIVPTSPTPKLVE
jgi:RHS repeat-associated protein